MSGFSWLIHFGSYCYSFSIFKYHQYYSVKPFVSASRKDWASPAEAKGHTRKWTEILESAVGIGALDAGDTLGVVSAKNKLLDHLGDPLDTESAVDDSVFAFVLFCDALKLLFKQNLKVIDSTRPVHPLGDRSDRKGELRLHIEL